MSSQPFETRCEMRAGAAAALVAGGAAIGLSIAAVAWLDARPGEPAFMAALAAATAAYLAALGLAARAAVPRRVLLVCVLLAAAWRLPLLTLPEAPAHDAVRYLWDARVVRAGLSPYEVRPDAAAVAHLHTTVTRTVDAAWLPTIYPPVAQLYFAAVAAIHESIAAFRVAALLCDAGVMAILWAWSRSGRGSPAWVLLYAWHPLAALEGASGAHVDFAGALLLLASWQTLQCGRTRTAALAFAASVLVKPLPLVLAPLWWRRVPAMDALVAVAGAAAVTLWIGRGGLPLGSTGAFVDDFRFNGPVFAALEPVLAPRAAAALAVTAGLAVAIWCRRTRPAAAPDAWAWPMAAALLASPVIYPWYLIWLLPFAAGRAAAPVLAWTVSILAIYPTWHLNRMGAAFAVPPPLLALEFAVPAATAVAVLALAKARTAGAADHG